MGLKTGSEVPNENPFGTDFLRSFFFNGGLVGLNDALILASDRDVADFERQHLAGQREFLRERNELLMSYSIAKAEKTNKLPIERMKQLKSAYERFGTAYLTKDMDADEEHDSVEYVNILNAGRWAREQGRLSLDTLTIDAIKELHFLLTDDLDRFQGVRVGFDPYNPGELRNNDDVRVGDYRPVDAARVSENFSELVAFVKKGKTLLDINLFTAALYAVHPFANGNKRLCRILEHALTRDLGLNEADIYSQAYYYAKNLDRFYSHIIGGLTTRNFVPMVNISREALFYEQTGVVKFALERRRKQFLDERLPDRKSVLYSICSAFVKTRSIKRKNLDRKRFRQIPERTMNDYLRSAVGKGILRRDEDGKNVYYSLAGDFPELDIIQRHIRENADRLSYIPSDLEHSVYPPLENWRSGAGTEKNPPSYEGSGREP